MEGICWRRSLLCGALARRGMTGLGGLVVCWGFDPGADWDHLGLVYGMCVPAYLQCLRERWFGCSVGWALLWSGWCWGFVRVVLYGPCGCMAWDEPESLILAQSERWRHA